MAIACLGERAPCLPSRICSISSRTNSPAAVVGLLPWRRSFFALWMVAFSGIFAPLERAPAQANLRIALRRSPALDAARNNGRDRRSLPEDAMDDARDEAMDWTHIRSRRIAPEDRKRFEGYLREIFTALGMPPRTAGTATTPERHLRAMFEATDGYEGDPKLITAFPTECKGGPDCKVSQVIEGPIPFYSLCEHHALPFFGHAYVGYIAHDNILGISKLTRIVRLFARRFTVQERIGREIADLIDRILRP